MYDTADVPFETESFLEYAFARWVLMPALNPGAFHRVHTQRSLTCEGRQYRLDFEIQGTQNVYVVELDGFEFHGTWLAFTYDRMRQNDIHSTGRIVIRYTYDSIRRDTRRCVEQLQALLAQDEGLRQWLVASPKIEKPDMEPDPLYSMHGVSGLELSPCAMSNEFSFQLARTKLNRRTLRDCQRQALENLTNYLLKGGANAACVMSVGAGKTALGVAACLVFAKKRALIITPGRVIRGTFDRALDSDRSDNVLYTLPGGPMIPGCAPPKTLSLDSDEGPIKDITRRELLNADIIVTNFHSLGTGDDPDDLLSKLESTDVDFIVVDEAHIAASESYQRCFKHFGHAKRLLMSACFARMDGRPIEADVVYRYRLIDSIVDGHAKTPMIRRFEPDAKQHSMK